MTLRPERSECIPRFLAILTNLRHHSLLAHACCGSNALRSSCINLVASPETCSFHRYSGNAVNFGIQCQFLSATTGVVAALDAATAVEPAVENPEPPHNSPPAPASEPEPAPALGTVDAEVLPWQFP